ncbi:MAG: threonine synthase [Eubacteriales bacterium]|nr:threonine synthase [Eubacteriales bacterium]
MQYESTRGGAGTGNAAQAVLTGLAGDGGLFVPRSIPRLTAGELEALREMDYTRRAQTILGKFFDDLPEAAQCAAQAYAGFEVPLVQAAPGAWVLELWHGPTAAFKDLALQFLPRVLSAAKAQQGVTDETFILVATSGDTGGAALAGFADVPGTRVAAFYPRNGVSDVQRLQMETQQAANAFGVAVEGNFDDAQRGVKAIFSDAQAREYFGARHCELSSANSINWGRLAPQIVYYFSAWCDLRNAGALAEGEPLDFVVPTGNFGNILSGWYAREMGLPIGHLVCASNRNRVLTDFFEQGVYDARRAFYKTISPSMDILVSSNLERLLYELSGRDAQAVAALMKQLSEKGIYAVSDTLQAQMRRIFSAGSAGDDATRATIKWVWDAYRYLLDPHTAVAWNVWEKTRGGNKAVIVSTASPFKFSADVLQALALPAQMGAQAQCEALSDATACPVPPSISALWSNPRGRVTACARDGMLDAAKRIQAWE